MRSILNGVTCGSAHWADIHDPAIVDSNCCLEQEVCVAVGCAEMHVNDWAEAKKEDPKLGTVLNWLKAQKLIHLKEFLAEHACSEEGRLILWNWQNLTIHQEALCLHSMPKGETEDLLLLCGPQGPLCHHLEWVPQGCRSSGMQPCPVFVMGALLVARDDQ